MHVAEVVGDRFEIERLAGEGGMGEVWKANDRLTNKPVAIKVLVQGADARFAREARILSELEHPHIVRYIAHGTTASGRAYLAMDWLEGIDLADLLAQGPLSVRDTVALGTIVAAALGFAHARGIVHRDLKPSNVYLVGGRIDQAMVLDFGIARLSAATRVTRTGMLMGTPGYMAPEQARGAEAVDARADVFSLGVMLFECLTQEQPFGGTHLPAILGRILFEAPPRLRDRRADVSEALENLVLQMLAKEPEDRPADGRAVVDALRSLGDVEGDTAGPVSRAGRSKAAIRGGEQRAVALILVGPHPQHVLTQAIHGPDATFVAVPDDQQLVKEATRHGGRAERLLDGTVTVLLMGTSLATDLAAQAARCALAMREFGRGRRFALAMSRGQTLEAGRGSLGQTIELVAKRLSADVSVRPDAGETPILIDDTVAGLLDARFDVREAEAGNLLLLGERALAEGTRLLLGLATPCVGRDRELRMLEQLLDECVDESVAQAVIVTAPAGVGKSRLAQEVLRSARGRSEPFRVWLGRGDALRAGSAFGLLGQVIRSATEVREGEPIEVRREKLVARIAERLPVSRRGYASVFLAELVGAPFPDDAHPLLSAARKDAQLMNDHLLHAWLEFLEAECQNAPALLVLEDLHWGDFPTVKFIDRALRDRKKLPFFVFALARPEVHEVFPRLWAERDVQEIRLKPLGAKAAERLARHVLGARASSLLVDRLIKLSDGNAFYLEELIRAAASGKSDDLPETVVAMVQSRLSELDDRARRILRAASIFGEVFWVGGVITLLGAAAYGPMMHELLAELSDRELLVCRSESRFPGETEYAFRHALLREGAYAMLPGDDRTLGHRLAGEWLDAHGERDPLVLAEHFELGGDGARAGKYYLLAAERATLGGDTAGTLAHLRKGLACQTPHDLRIELMGYFCETHYFMREAVANALPYAEEVVRDAPMGSRPWIQAMFIKMMCAAHAGRLEDFGMVLFALGQIEPQPGTETTLALTLTSAAYIVDIAGQPQMGDAIMARLETIARNAVGYDPRAMATWCVLTAARSAYAHRDPWRGRMHAEMALNVGRMVEHTRLIAISQSFLGMQTWFLGAREEAESLLLGISLTHEELGFGATPRPICLSWILAEKGELDEARKWAERLTAFGKSRNLPIDEGEGHWVMAEVLRRAGDLQGADLEIDAAVKLLCPKNVLDTPAVMATLARIRLAEGRVFEAVEAAERGMTVYDRTQACAYFRGAFLRLAHIESLEAAGQHEKALDALRRARAEVLANADKIHDPKYRQHFLEDSIEPRRIMELSRERLAE